jgi:hypothetical protein
MQAMKVIRLGVTQLNYDTAKMRQQTGSIEHKLEDSIAPY